MKNYKLLALFFLIYSCSGTEQSEELIKTLIEKSGVEKYYNEALKPFYHGVASGDPTANAVMIWTKISPEWHETVQVNWQIASDSSMTNILQEGKTNTDSSRNYTVKVDVQNLQPGQFYYYRFTALGKNSLVGRTKTLAGPDDDREIKLAFASCSNYAWGYFNSYALMAKDSLDAIIHLGDYIYEHEPQVYNSGDPNREHLPAKELISLTDYRTRYSQYRLDPDLIEAHRMHPFITVWDDHEFANNTWKSGAGNHQENEGDWSTRFEAAKKAYYEWMPVREQGNEQLYRSFEFGNNVKLLMLDTRIEGRDEQVYDEKTFALDTSRKMISEEQFKWIESQLSDKHSWNIFGNQVLFSSTKVYFSGSKGELYADGWAAYPHQQKRMMELISAYPNTFFVTGDFHSSFYIPFDYFSDKSKSLNTFIEVVVPSISAGNYDEDFGIDTAEIYRKYYLNGNPNMLFADVVHHGYVKLILGKSKNGTPFARNEFRYVETVTERIPSKPYIKSFVFVLEEYQKKKMLRLIP